MICASYKFSIVRTSTMDRCSVVIALHACWQPSLLSSQFSFWAFSNCAMFDFSIGFTIVQSIDNDVILRLSWQLPFIVRDSSQFTFYRYKVNIIFTSIEPKWTSCMCINEPSHNRNMSSITFSLSYHSQSNTHRALTPSTETRNEFLFYFFVSLLIDGKLREKRVTAAVAAGRLL